MASRQDGEGAVVLWWIANAVALFVVIPLVVHLANNVIRPALEIRGYADDILEHGVELTSNLDPLASLAETKAIVERVSQNTGDYVTALRRRQR